MGYRELSRMHVQEVVRRWQAKESQRAIARSLGVARDTVRRYIGHAEGLGLSQTGPPPTENQVIELSRLAHEGLAHGRAQPSTVQLDPYKERLAGWVDEGMQLSRMLELLSSEVIVSYSSLRRFLARTGLASHAQRTRQQAEALKEEIASVLANELKLTLSPAKTLVTHIDDGFDFLGFRIMRKARGGKRQVYTFPSRKAFVAVKRAVKALTPSHAALVLGPSSCAREPDPAGLDELLPLCS